MPQLSHMHYLAISHVCPISGAVLPALLGLDLPQNAKYCNVIILCSQLIRTSPPSAEIHTIGNGSCKTDRQYDNGGSKPVLNDIHTIRNRSCKTDGYDDGKSNPALNIARTSEQIPVI